MVHQAASEVEKTYISINVSSGRGNSDACIIAAEIGSYLQEKFTDDNLHKLSVLSSTGEPLSRVFTENIVNIVGGLVNYSFKGEVDVKIQVQDELVHTTPILASEQLPPDSRVVITDKGSARYVSEVIADQMYSGSPDTWYLSKADGSIPEDPSSGGIHISELDPPPTWWMPYPEFSPTQED